jgi:hypothetical protein
MIEQQEEIKERELTPKAAIRLNLSTRGTIGALESHNQRHPDQCIVKRELIPSIVRRTSWIMEEEYDPIFDQLAIPIPKENWIKNNWPAICRHAADKYRKYIVYDHTGVRLGTFTEYQEIPATKLFPIVKGIIKTGGQRAKIIKEQGGDCLVMDVSSKLLSSGE